jgi:hypothetical protein
VIIAWEPFEPGPEAGRAEIRTLGRAASRRALAVAARAWRTAHGDAPWIGAALVHDSDGAPRLDAPGAPLVSVTHGRGLAGCALAAPGGRWVGLDAERTEAPGMRAVRELAERSGEAALAWPDAAWPARLWCAKEAVVKAERSAADLLGRTLRVVAARPLAPGEPSPLASPEHMGVVVVTVESHRARTFLAHTAQRGPFTVAAVHAEAPRA